MAESLEKLLKRARLDKKLNLNDVTRDLKIKKDHIRQFEQQIQMPLGVYELGYLRCYAKYLEVDINDYIADLKGEANAVAQEGHGQSENRIFSILKISSGKLIMTVSLVGVLISIIFFVATNKIYFRGFSYNKNSSEQILKSKTESHDNDSNVVSISAKLSVEQKGPYDYLINSVGSDDGNINVIARVNTNFTMIDPTRNKVIRSGGIHIGERLFIPKKQGDNVFTSLLVKTNIPNAFDIQNNTQNN